MVDNKNLLIPAVSQNRKYRTNREIIYPDIFHEITISFTPLPEDLRDKPPNPLRF